MNEDSSEKMAGLNLRDVGKKLQNNHAEAGLKIGQLNLDMADNFQKKWRKILFESHSSDIG